MINCIYCNNPISEKVLLDLGPQAPANALCHSPHEPEILYPLLLVYCQRCDLYQRGVIQHQEIPLFNQSYPYRTRVNQGYLKQCLMHHQRDREDFGLDPKQHKILEIGCNDASNLEFWFSQGYSVCGYEPCFHESMNEKMSKYIISTPFHCQAPLDYDYIYAYNVIAHIFHLQDFISDIAKSLKKQGILVIECPLFEELCRLGAWDTIYHEHFAYFTMRSLYKIFAKHGLYIFRMNPLKSHGGSIRAYFSKEKRTLEPTLRPDTDHLQAVFDRDRQQLPERMQAYKYPAFGAAAKGITLLNTLGIKADTIPYCIDETPEKQGKYMPMSKIPILGKEVFKNGQRYFNLAWNHQEEISKKYPEQIFIPIR